MRVLEFFTALLTCNIYILYILKHLTAPWWQGSEMPSQFEWDDEKDRSNRAKHGIGFEEAKVIFRQPSAHRSG